MRTQLLSMSSVLRDAFEHKDEVTVTLLGGRRRRGFLTGLSEGREIESVPLPDPLAGHRYQPPMTVRSYTLSNRDGSYTQSLYETTNVVVSVAPHIVLGAE